MAVKAAVMLTERMKPELMTCHDIVATGRYPYTGRLGILSREDERKVDEALEAVHAQELGIRNFQEISDGQRQRVLLARAICQEPEVMILDEPTSYLDIRHKLELLTILRKMAKENGITVIMSLHEIDLAQKYRIRLSASKATGLPNLVIRKKYSRKQQFVIFMKSTMVITIRYSEVWNFQSRKENRKFWYYLPVKQESRSTENFRKPGIPFAAGILYPGESDYQLARLLASGIISEEPYEPISDETYQKALKIMEKCGKVINAGVKVGSMNQKMGNCFGLRRREGCWFLFNHHGGLPRS